MRPRCANMGQALRPVNIFGFVKDTRHRCAARKFETHDRQRRRPPLKEATCSGAPTTR
jgi:hypothetical protein